MKIYQSLLVLLFVVSFALTGCDIFGGNNEGMKQVVFNTSKGVHTYYIEVADTKETRSEGLMNRESLDEDKGMIFIYEEERIPAFWMKNTLISLDMIFMDKNFKVVDFFKDVPPCEEDPCIHYIPKTASQYILELNAGQINRIQLQRGDIAEYK